MLLTAAAAAAAVCVFMCVCVCMCVLGCRHWLPASCARQHADVAGWLVVGLLSDVDAARVAAGAVGCLQNVERSRWSQHQVATLNIVGITPLDQPGLRTAQGMSCDNEE